MKLRPAVDDLQPALKQMAIARQKVNIHIDRMRISAPCTHEPIGKVMYFEDEELGHMPSGATADQLTLKDGGEKAYIRSKQIDPRTGLAHMLEIHCCPPLVLQKHNLFGHAVLQDYVYEVLDLATKRLNIRVDPFDREEWKAGGVSITEIHLTANFACPQNAVIPIIQAIDENNTEGKLRPTRSWITLGISAKRRSTYHVLTIYGKWQELMKRFKTPGLYQTKLIEEAKRGIRAEVKLYSQKLKQLGLGYVMRWRDVDVSALFFEFFNKYRIQYSIQRLLTDDELACLTMREKNVYILWLNGMSIKDQFKSRTAAWKYAKAISAKTGIDIMGGRRPETLPEIDLNEIFTPENVLPVPAWAIGTEYYFAPRQTGATVPPPPRHARGISNVPVYPEEDEITASFPKPRRFARGIGSVPVYPDEEQDEDDHMQKMPRRARGIGNGPIIVDGEN